ncbi:MAG: hypothetical protein KIT34_04480 [Cyanobacteria bacterium TGS_CYA1]|nr:hypothetical protein [Cyanobacteria bacterium TGS_CYA1]
MTKKHIYALILPAMLVLSVYSPTKGHCADNNKKQLAVLSEPASPAQNASGVHPHPVIHVKNQLNAMSQHVSDTTTDSINQYLSSLSPAVKAAGGYFHNAIKQYGDWIMHFGKQNTSFAPEVRVTPAAARF